MLNSHFAIYNKLGFMIRAFIVIAAITALGGCVPMQVADSAGARGQVIVSGSRKPIQNAQICLVDAARMCSASNEDGSFDLKPILREKWQFILIESFPNFRLGDFVINAEGYREHTLRTNYFSPRIIEMEPIK